MVSAGEALSLLLVGALWGCTNPFLRKGWEENSKNKSDTATSTYAINNENNEHTNSSNYSEKYETTPTTLNSLLNLRRIQIWLPYLLNQLGSLLYYKSLASSSLSLSVPICNATALVFSSITSVFLGERLNHPAKAALGVAFILVGVSICMYSSEERIKEGRINGHSVQYVEL